MRIAVVIPTVGRAEMAAKTVRRLALQTRPADRVVVSATKEEDVAGLRDDSSTTVILSRPGASDQRNAALATVQDDVDVIFFMDDDFVPSLTYLAEVESLFTQRPDVVGLTGHLVVDGAIGPGVGYEDALELLERAAPSGLQKEMEALYGCNMALRTAAIGENRFDEKLPLYAWLEDIDFSSRLAARGLLVKSGRLYGVHLGIKRGRTSGVRFGYSQVANVVYLKRKGTMQPKLGRRLLTAQLSSNLLKSIAPEAYIDRRGRLKGNALAVWDLIRGKLDTERIRKL